MSARPSPSPPAFPAYDRGEVIADTCVHFVGVSAGIAAVATLLAAAARHADMRLLLGVGLYGAGLLAMLTFSALYSLARPSGRKEWLRRFDHAAIFVMIAGSYTPFLLSRIGGAWGFGMLAFVWLAAAAGATLALTAPRRHERLELAAYLALGWCVLVTSGRLFTEIAPTAILLLIIGGLIYSLGVIVLLWRRLGYHNAIWHGLVLIAAGCHYAAVFVGVVLAG
jgi:hemolysin III